MKSNLSFKVIGKATAESAGQALELINLNDHYTEDIRQYNGTGDPVVVTKEHPVGSLMRYHDHNFFEINYVVRGSCTNMIEGQRLNMHTGDFVLLHPETLHTLYVGKGSYTLNFLMDITWLQKLFFRLTDAHDRIENEALDFARHADSSDAYKFIFFPRESRCVALAHSMMHSFDLPFRSVFREAVMTQFLVHAFTTCQGVRLSASRGISSDVFKNIYSFTAQNYAAVTQEALADTFHYSRSYICKLFKDHTGKSFSHNLMEIRLHQAQTLLITTNLSIEEIAYAVGYTSVEYFHRIFRQKFGTTPGDYRKAH